MRNGVRVATLILAMTAALCVTNAVAESSIFHLDGGYARSIEAESPGGSFAFGLGLIVPVREGRFGVGGEVGYAMLGSRPDNDGNERWSAGHMSGEGFLFLKSRDRARLYPCVGLGFYDFRGVTRAWAREHPRTMPPIETLHGVFGINGGFGWMSGDPDGKAAFGFDARVHSLSTSGSRTEIFLFMASLYF